MKKLFTLIISLAVYGITFGTDVTGTIAVNTTWNLAGSPYIVIGDITVNNGVTLTVDPNVIVKFNSGRRMTVLGTLNANTATFTSNQAVPAPNDWLYIQIGNASFAGAKRLQVVSSDTPRVFTFIAGQPHFQVQLSNTSITMVCTTQGH